MLCYKFDFRVLYSKRHNKYLFLALAGAIYGSFRKTENEILMLLTIKIINTIRKTRYFYILSRHLYLLIKRENQIFRIIYDIFPGVYNIDLFQPQIFSLLRLALWSRCVCDSCICVPFLYYRMFALKVIWCR